VPATPRFEIANFEKWGKLVKTWATGVNKLEDGNAYPLPQDNLQLFKEQCVMAQVGATVPSYVTTVLFVQAGIPGEQKINAPTFETLLFRLPPKKLVEETEAELQNANYAIPTFYNRIFDRPGGPTSIGDKMKLHAERIGEYTMNVCM
jgi:hypothetical protein